MRSPCIAADGEVARFNRAVAVMQSWLWCMLPVFGVLAWLIWRDVPVTLNAEPLQANASLAASFIVIAVLLARFTAWRSAATAFHALALMVACLPLSIIAIYGVAWLSRDIPLCDAVLASWDQTLGLDWLGYLQWLSQRPQIAQVFEAVYRALPLAVPIAPLLLCLWRMPHRAQQFLAAFFAALVLCAIITAFVPATGAYYFYGIEPTRHHPLIALPTSQLHVPDFLAMRAGSLGIFSVNKAAGIVSFPSFHTAAAIIFAWAFYPAKILRWPALAWNGIMLAATPLYGGHYFVDALAGAGIAMAGIAVAEKMWRLAQQRAAQAMSIKGGIAPAPVTAEAVGLKAGS